nr:XdhC family protein [Streptomyces sp. NBC_00886]
MPPSAAPPTVGRAPGARLPERKDGSTVGNLTGGCLDAETVDAADEVERTGAPGR